MVYAIGDSHAACSFRDIPEVQVAYVGPVTLKRVGILEDALITNTVGALNLNPTDTIIFVFGEIDIRCYIKVNLDHHKTYTLESLLREWVKSYCHHISLMPTNGAKIAIMSIVPPAPYTSAQSVDWPISGSDEERVLYTQKINEIIKSECESRNWIYLDVYSKYADEKGMLPLENIYISVHLKNTTEVKNLLSIHRLI